MQEMKITSAQYVDDFEGTHLSINAIVNGEQLSVPMCEGNRHYAEIMRQVEAGELTIADAD